MLSKDKIREGQQDNSQIEFEQQSANVSVGRQINDIGKKNPQAIASPSEDGNSKNTPGIQLENNNQQIIKEESRNFIDDRSHSEHGCVIGKMERQMSEQILEEKKQEELEENLHEDSDGYMDDPNITLCCTTPRKAFTFIGWFTMATGFGVIFDIIIYAICATSGNKRWTVKLIDHFHTPFVLSVDNKYYLNPSFVGQKNGGWLPVIVLTVGLLMVVPCTIYEKFLRKGERTYLVTAHMYILFIQFTTGILYLIASVSIYNNPLIFVIEYGLCFVGVCLEIFFMTKAKEYSESPRVYDKNKWIVDNDKKNEENKDEQQK